MTNPSGLSLLTFNIGNPSLERARHQLAWLADRPEQVLVLTGTKLSDGCRLLADAFGAAGYRVIHTWPEPGEYGAMIASRVEAVPDAFPDRVGYLPARAAAVVLPTPTGPLRLIGLYTPSRDASPVKTERKQKWLAACDTALAGGQQLATVLLGDLNILEPGHRPHYPFFAPFEYDFYRALVGEHHLVDAFRLLHPTADAYSWVGRTGDGYRYDHALCSASLRSRITDCHYVDEPRTIRLSDHSALTLTLAVPAFPVHEVTDPRGPAEPDTRF